jgi:hypothetical protein
MVPLGKWPNLNRWPENEEETFQVMQAINDHKMAERALIDFDAMDKIAQKEMDELFGPKGECLYCKTITYLSYYGIACDECVSYLPG